MFPAIKIGKGIDCSQYHFSDASQDEYGKVSYLRLVDQKGMIHCGLVMAKSRVTPIKFVSIPRLELAAATLSIKVCSERNWQFILNSKSTSGRILKMSWATSIAIRKDLKFLWRTEFNLSKKTQIKKHLILMNILIGWLIKKTNT